MVRSQNVNDYVEMGKDYIGKKHDVDSLYIYQPEPRFSFALTGKAQQVGFFSYANFNLNFFDQLILPSESVSYLGERIYKKVGFEVGYGGLSFGYDVEVGRKDSHKRRALSFGMQNLKWGARISYYTLQNTIISSMTIGEPGNLIYDSIELSDRFGKMRNLSLDGYYVFKHRKFAYTATNNVSVIQRRTNGSFMLATRFMWADLDTKEDMTGLFEAYSTVQFSVGGGYSANFVLWNRDAVNNDDRTVRNITYNITLLPVISLVNYMQTRAYETVINLEDDTETQTMKKSDIWCYPKPNLMGSTAISFTWGHVYFNTMFTLNWFYFSSTDAINSGKFDAPAIQIEGYDGDVIQDLRIHGVLYNWTLTAKVVYRF